MKIYNTNKIPLRKDKNCLAALDILKMLSEKKKCQAK